MTVMSEQQYEVFKQAAQAKATGANIHFINGQLGLIVNAVKMVNAYAEKEKLTEAQQGRYDRACARYSDAMKKLRTI